MSKNKEEKATPKISSKPITIGIVVDGKVFEKFQVTSPRLASLFLSNPTFTEIES